MHINIYKAGDAALPVIEVEHRRAYIMHAERSGEAAPRQRGWQAGRSWLHEERLFYTL